MSFEVGGIRRRRVSTNKESNLCTHRIRKSGDFKIPGTVPHETQEETESDATHIKKKDEGNDDGLYAFSSASSCSSSSDENIGEAGQSLRHQEANSDAKASPNSLNSTDAAPQITKVKNRKARRSGYSPRATTRSGRNRTRGNNASSNSSWSGYDLSIIVALVSPIGNILTGSDHVKNILLLLFLIYYLHQLVEVPWTLYRLSILSEENAESAYEDDPVKAAAQMELRSLEILYLSLTVLSPFIGATLLRYVATLISGDPKILSWFSTSLFVLATGVRPWTHLAERLKDRTQALNEILENSSTSRDEDIEDELSDAGDGGLDEEFTHVTDRLDFLDHRINELAAANIHEWEDISEAVYEIENAVRQIRVETIRRNQTSEDRLDALENFILGLQASGDLRLYSPHSHLKVIAWEFITLPWALSVWGWEAVCNCTSKALVIATYLSKKGILHRPSISISARRYHTLETIAEEHIRPLSSRNNTQSRIRTEDSDKTIAGNPSVNEMKSITSYFTHPRQIVSVMVLPFTISIRIGLFFATLPLKPLRLLRL